MLYDPGTEGQTWSVYFVASMGLLTGDSILLHVWLNDPHVVREYRSWGQVYISLCRKHDHNVLCIPGQYTVPCVLGGEIIAGKEAPGYYLGHRQVFLCPKAS